MLRRRTILTLSLTTIVLGSGALIAERTSRAPNQRPEIQIDYPRGTDLIIDAYLPFPPVEWLQPVVFSVTVTDFENDLVSLTLLNPAPGISFDPIKNEEPPVTRTVRWNPHDTDLPGHFVFEARDDETGRPRRARVGHRAPNGRGRTVLLEDMTGDGRLDVLGLSHLDDTGRGAFYVWSHDATALQTARLRPTTFGTHGFGATTSVSSLTFHYDFGDFTGDGVRDLLVPNTLELNLFSGAGMSGDLAPIAVLSTGFSQSYRELYSAHDIDGDRIRDIVAQDIGGGLVFWKGGVGLTGSPAPTAFLAGPGADPGVPLRMRHVDLTGDGTEDLLAFSRLDVAGNLEQGVLMWDGSVPWTGTVPATAYLYGPALNAFIERQYRTYDIDQDGIQDLINGVSSEGIGVHWGGPHLFGERPPDATLIMPHHASVAAPRYYDVTGDGHVAIGLNPTGGANGVQSTGLLYVWRFDGVHQTGPIQPAVLFDPTAEEAAKVGSSGLLIGDVTGDGIADILAASREADVGSAIDAGKIHVWAGGPHLAGDQAPTATLQSQNPENFDALARCHPGGAFQLIDIDADGVLDVIAGAQEKDIGFNNNAGAIQIWYGGVGLTGTVTADALLIASDARPGDQLGNLGELDLPTAFPTDGPVGELSIRFLDVTGDGLLDIITATHLADAPGFVDNVGAAYVWAGGSLQGTVTETAVLRVAGATEEDRMGRASGHGLQLADVTDDGIVDIILGAHEADPGGVVDAGAVYVWKGGPTLVGTPAPMTLTTDDATPGAQLGLVDEERHSQGIVIGDATGDGILDILAVAPLADLFGNADAGAIYLFQGPITGSMTQTKRLRRQGPIVGGMLGY